MPLPTPALYAATPTLLVDGTADPALGARVLTATVEEDTDGLRRCELVLGNWGETGDGLGHVLSDRRTVDFGTALEIAIGEGDRRGTVFAGAVTGLEEQYPAGGSPRLAVLAEDQLQNLRMTRRTRTFEDVTDADVVRQVAGEHGLRAEVDLDEVRYRVLGQLAVSDLAFLRDRVRAVGGELWVAGGALHAQARARREAGELTLTLGADLRELRVLADLAHQRTAVVVSGWDVLGKDTIEHRAGEEAVSVELDGGTSGPATLSQAFGERVEQVVDAVPLGTAEARTLAEAHQRRRSRRFLTGSAVAEGDARIDVGSRVRLAGVADPVAGAYTVTAVRHTFDGAAGFVTFFGVERPGLGTTP
jgi:uncharacterized protein